MASITRQITQEGIKIVTRTVTEKLINDHAKAEIRKELDKMPEGEPVFIPAIAVVSREDVKSGVAPAETPVIITDKETMIYQLGHLKAEATMLETHLSEGAKILGKRCDCVNKHSGKLKMLAQETIPIASRTGMDTSIYNDIITWASKVEEIPMDAPDTTYQADSGKAGVFRKRLLGMLKEVKGA